MNLANFPDAEITVKKTTYFLVCFPGYLWVGIGIGILILIVFAFVFVSNNFETYSTGRKHDRNGERWGLGVVIQLTY